MNAAITNKHFNQFWANEHKANERKIYAFMKCETNRKECKELLNEERSYKMCYFHLQFNFLQLKLPRRMYDIEFLANGGRNARIGG